MEVQLQNRLENAYNTSLTLHYSKNLHFSSLSIRVKPDKLKIAAENSKLKRRFSCLALARRRMLTLRSSAPRSMPTATCVTSAIRCSAPSPKYVLQQDSSPLQSAHSCLTFPRRLSNLFPLPPRLFAGQLHVGV